jgi:formylglycine-generating enzyme
MAEPRLPSGRTVTRRVALLALACATVTACAKLAGIDGLEIGECKGGGLCLAEGGTEDRADIPPEDGSVNPMDVSTFDSSSKPCPTGTKGPVMVRVGTSTNNFCIDESEVTVKQYTDFVTAKAGDAAGQPPQCSWNTSYQAAFGGANDIPIAGIDWCDAREYCRWAGKRLCGKHKDGAHVGAVAIADLADFTTHEWLVTCSNLGQLRYPYGGIQQASACNTGENDAGRTVPVKSKSTCQGGFPGVYDMVGNLWEWYDGPCAPFDGGADASSIDAGPAKDECYVKGGSFLNSGTPFDCRVDGRGASRDRRGQEIGFRCCAD